MRRLAVLLFAVALGWVGSWLSDLRALPSKRLTDPPNFKPVTTLALGVAVLGYASHALSIGPGTSLPWIVAGAMLIALWRHPFARDWNTPLVRLGCLAVAAFVLVANLDKAFSWNLFQNGEPWYAMWAVPLALVPMALGAWRNRSSASEA